VIISAKDINSELKAKIMRSAEEFMNKDLIFSRLKNNSKYALNHLIFRKGIEGNNNLISEFSDKIDTFRSQSFALQSYLELLPIILNPDDILSIFNKIQSSSLAYHNLYNALLNGIFYSTGLIVYQDILFITEDAQNKNSILRDKLTLLNNLKANNQELAHEHILLLFLFDRKKSVEMMLNGKNLINRLACAWHLCFHGCDEAKVMFNKVKVEEVKNNFDWFIRHLANACLLNMESFVKKNIVKYSENFPDHYEGRIEIKNNPGLHFKHLLVMSFLGRSAQFNNHRRLSESLFPDHFFLDELNA
jgi:hypothetical protein